MNTLSKGLLVLAILLVAGVGLLVWKVNVGGHGGDSLNKLTKEDLELLVKDASPMVRKRLAEDAEGRKKELGNIKQFIAMAAEARRTGLDKEAETSRELENVKSEVIAVSYDREKNKDKGPMPPFGFIEQPAVDEFYAQPGNEAKFEEFFAGKIAQAKKQGMLPEGEEVPEEQKKMGKDTFAKIKIYEEEFNKSTEVSEEFKKKIALQVKLQQAQFLARLYSEKVMKDKLKVEDSEVEAYIKEHPEYDTSAKKTKADEILAKVKAGGDFAALAKEFSEDPGSKDKGGLYEKVMKDGGFDPKFEGAALALEPGQVVDQPVETQFGYHIIKLEKKQAKTNDQGKETVEYDVRHILISTMIKDPNNPMDRGMPAKEKAKSILEEEKEKKHLEEIVARNHVEVAEDFNIPQPTEEEMKKMQEQMKQQMPMPMPEQEEGGKGDKKPEAKKK